MTDICTKYGEWWEDTDPVKELPRDLFRIYDDLGLLKLKTKVVSSKRFLVYHQPSIDIAEVVSLLRTVPKAKTVKEFEAHGWVRGKRTMYGGYWSGNRDVPSIRRGIIEWPYYYACNLSKFKDIAERYIKILEGETK